MPLVNTGIGLEPMVFDSNVKNKDCHIDTYGISGGDGLDFATKKILNKPFKEYMDNFVKEKMACGEV